MTDSNTIPVFTHIPKTAGTTLNRVIEWQYMFKRGLIYDVSDIRQLERFKTLSLKEKKKIKVVKGHIPFDIHIDYPFPVRYFTMLRQPQKRSISHYYHILKWYKYNPKFRKMDLKNYTLRQFLESGIRKEFDNCHVRYLCGVPDIPYGEVNEGHLQMAIHNLKAHYPAIGITELFNESLLLFAKEFNWTNPYCIESNVSRIKTNEVKTDKETQALLDHYNRYDEVLYKTALDIFDGQIIGAGAGFKDEVNSFIEENEKRRSSTIAGIHFTSKLRYLNKHHLWNIKHYLLEYLKSI